MALTSRATTLTFEQEKPTRTSRTNPPPSLVARSRARHALQLTIDASIVLIALAIAGFFYSSSMSRIVIAIGVLTVASCWMLLLARGGAYDPWRGRAADRAVVGASARVAALIAILAQLLEHDLPALIAFATIAGTTLSLIVSQHLDRWLTSGGRRKHAAPLARVIAIGDRVDIASLISSAQGRPEESPLVVGACTPSSSDGVGLKVPTVSRTEDVRDAARALRADLVLLIPGAELETESIRTLAWSLEGSGVRFAVAPAITGVAEPRIRVQIVGGRAIAHVSESRRRPRAAVLKAVIDRGVAGLGLILALPLLFAIALAIKIDSAGPVLFRQPRVGQGGELFDVFKFRTMKPGADAMLAELADHNECDGLLFKMKSDPRVTRLGSWLRKWSLDELPQLLNVVRGDMSLVGPRPLPVSPDSFIGSERRRLEVLPGITGLWQISGRSDINWSEAVALDIYYVDNWSIFLDLKILALTPLTIARKTGAY